MFAESCASKAVNFGAVPILLQMFCDWQRTDHHHRQANIRKAILNVIKNITMSSKLPGCYIITHCYKGGGWFAQTPLALSLLLLLIFHLLKRSNRKEWLYLFNWIPYILELRVLIQAFTMYHPHERSVNNYYTMYINN